MVSEEDIRCQKKEVRRGTLIIFFLIVCFLTSAGLAYDFYENRDSVKEGAGENKVCIKCHTRISGQRISQEIRMKTDKRCIECHGPEDFDETNMSQGGRNNEDNLPLPPLAKGEMGGFSYEKMLFTSVGRVMPVSKEAGQINDMALIPAGNFIMGNNGRSREEGEGDLDERPNHKVYVDAFYIDRYEVTNADYKKFVDATGHRLPIRWKNGNYPPGKERHPAVYVSWTDAFSYCQWAGKRLPAEDEWEKAGRGTDGRHFPWGNEFDPMKANTPQYWLNIGKKGDTMPVGSFEEGKSPYGLYDMAGNVYEWTDNWYKPYPGNRFPNVHYGEKNKVMRGGSWYDCLSYGCGLSSPVYNRTRFTPEIRNNNTGFRCAKNP